MIFEGLGTQPRERLDVKSRRLPVAVPEFSFSFSPIGDLGLLIEARWTSMGGAAARQGVLIGLTRS
jgi:hypothetical protein